MKILIIIGVGIVTLILAIGLVGLIVTSKDRLKEKFFAAIRSGDLESVKKLLTKKSITVNVMDRNYLTPLTITASQGNIEMARLLIDSKADVNSTGGLRHFPVLMFAVTEGQTEMVKFLIDQGADVNAVANNSNDGRHTNGITALMMAVAKGNNQIVELLIEKGAEAEKSSGASVQNKKSEMSLTSAVWYDELKTVRSLLDKGADVNGENKDGLTVLQAMQAIKDSGTYKKDYSHIVEILKAAGARED